jgi:hypothetical protein
MRTMRFRVGTARFAVLFEPGDALPARIGQRCARDNANIVNITIEPGGTSAVVPEDWLDDLDLQPGARVERGYRIVEFVTPMGWDVVGFLALVTNALARAGVPLGAICSFDRDYLFLREAHLDRARSALATGVCPEA